MVRGILKNLGENSIVYAISALSVRFLSFLLFPFFARKFTPEQYGDINIFNNLTFFVNAFIVLGMDSATSRFIYDSADNQQLLRKKLISTWFFTQTTSAILTGSLLLLFGSLFFVNQYIHAPNGLLILSIVVVNFILQTGVLITNTTLVLNRQAKKSALFSFASAIIATIASLLFVFVFQIGLLGFFLGQTVSFFLYAVAGYLFVLKEYVQIQSYSFNLLKNMLRYGISLIPANLSTYFLLLVSSFIIQAYAGPKELGFFQIALTLSSALMLFTMPFNMAFQPLSFSIMHKPESGRFFSLVLTIYSTFLSFICLTLSVFFPNIIDFLVTNRYAPSAYSASLLTMGTFIFSLVNIANIGLAIVKKVSYYAVVVTVSNIVTMLLVYLFIRWKGFDGVAFALLLGQSLSVVAIFLIAHRFYKLPYNYGKVTFTVLMAIALIVSFYNGAFSFLHSFYLDKVMPLLIFLAACLVLNYNKLKSIIALSKKVCNLWFPV
jgi:O-antigen/teichoic acid export membrane protein